MADNTNTKIIQTIICNRIDDLAKWDQSTVILERGEIALAIVKNELTDTTSNIPSGDAGEAGQYTRPTVMMKVGDGNNTFANLKWLAAPASDVYEWAKKENLAYDDLPTDLKTAITDIQSKFANLKNNTVQEAIDSAVNSINATTSGEGVVTGVTYSKGTITVARSKITNSVIDDAAISMDKIEGLRALNTTVGDNTSGLVKQVTDLQNKLSNVTNVMDFVGAVEQLPETTAGYQNGDVIVVIGTGKEYVANDGIWIEFGHADATDTAVVKLQKLIYGDGESDSPDTPANNTILKRLDELEYEIGETTGNDNHTSLKDRVTTAESNITNIQENYVTTKGTSDTLSINSQVIIFNCGDASAREGIDRVASNS